MAIRVVCDRCGECVEGTVYYTIDIYAKDARTTHGVSFETVTRNLSLNTSTIFGTEPCYCKRCIEDIEDYIRSVSVREEKER